MKKQSLKLLLQNKKHNAHQILGEWFDNLYGEIEEVLKVQAQLLLKSAQKITIDSSTASIYVGIPDPTLGRHPLVEGIRIFKDGIYLKLEREDQYFEMHEFSTLSLGDKLEIARFLQTQLTLP